MLKDIENIFKDRNSKIIGEFKENAVMFLLKEINGETYICFEMRSLALKFQPGDICLPGGRVEKNEKPLEAAIRETKEELNLEDKDMEYIGQMDYFVSPYNAIIYSFVSKINKEEIYPSKEEVDHIFWVPLKFFMENEPLCYEVKIKPVIEEDFPFNFIRGGENYKFNSGKLKQYFYKYENYVIWGFTAMIVKWFTELIKKEL